MTPRLELALLFGGRSGEHAVSLRSAASVSAALRTRFDVHLVLIDRTGSWFLQPGPEPAATGGVPVFVAAQPADHGCLRRTRDASVAANPAVYFPLVHGTYGEDGTLQGLLELAAVPYVGAGVAASAAAMDKELMKALFAQAGVPQVPYRTLRAGRPPETAALVAGLGLPLFVKPANLGSSVAVSKVKREAELAGALAAAFAYDTKVLVEAAVDAREIEVSVIGNREPEASLPGEIVPDREFYDYDSKYSATSQTRLLIPAPLTRPEVATLRALAVQAFRAVDACGYGRVDFFIDRASGRLLVNELNTIPGFTSISMFPKLWEASGLSYPDLLARLVDLALDRHAERARLRTDYGA